MVIRTYRAAVTTQVRCAGYPGPLWQRGFYEPVVRGEKPLHRLREYIEANPARWDLDAENPDSTQ